jgi:hypothetical protein
LNASLLWFSCHRHLGRTHGDIDRSITGTGTKATSHLVCASKHTDSISSAMAAIQARDLHGLLILSLTSREGLD